VDQARHKQLEWINIFLRKRREELTAWVSTFHPGHLQCSLVHEEAKDDGMGSFNVGSTVRFTNGELWIVRFPRGGKILLANEKVEAEVATIDVIRKQTTIPVPEIKAWGRAADNSLGIGPFIMTNYVEGLNLGLLLGEPDDLKSRFMRSDVSEESLKTLFSQIAGFVLQLSKLEFGRIGNISTEAPADDDQHAATVRSRPLTLKAHDILSVGGVDTLCSYYRSNLGMAGIHANLRMML